MYNYKKGFKVRDWMSTEGLIALLEKKRNHLSKIENQVLDYILTHMTEISSQTIYEVAQALFVSTATISRTAKHLGYRGFQELKYAIVQSVQSESTESDSRSFQAITQQLIANVQDSFQQMDEAKVAEMLKMIEGANTIEVFGVGGSFPICTDFARKLTFLGKKAYARSDWDEQAAAVKNLDGQDLAIFVSYTGETKGILAYARVAQEQQVPMISLISTKGSTLEKLSTTTLFAKGTTRYHQRVDLSSRIAVICLFDTVLLMYAEAKQPR
ncbi:MurR/RpiR family transcriptional regulator [Enterococcus faecalis]|nr:MurR/RpiR family transcriptional regulator [Enterococcus faecalis]EGO6704196.1 MurR/RpiR family transcriptional regulator [Enterococcus faecalis]